MLARLNGWRRAAVTGLAVSVAALVATTALAAPASAHTRTHDSGSVGTTSLAQVLAKDGSGFDHNWYDFDILDNAVTAVLAAKPDSPVAVLADGTVPLTAFLPTDAAFRSLAQDLLKKKFSSESDVFTALATNVPIDTLEAVLLYHVIPGVTVTYWQALQANGQALPTALAGTTVTVKVRYCFLIQLKDNDPDSANPFIVFPNINKGNKQIGHAINRVLRPINLP